MRYILAILIAVGVVTGLNLTVHSSGGNSSSQLLYGLLYEVKIYQNLIAPTELIMFCRTYTILEMEASMVNLFAIELSRALEETGLPVSPAIPTFGIPLAEPILL
jgi:hypothetical protein